MSYLEDVTGTYGHPDDWNVPAITLIEIMATELEGYFEGGTEFFDRIDALLSSDYFYAVQLRRFTEKYDPSEHRIIVSGKWGFGFKNWMMKYIPEVRFPVLVPGGLRHNELPVKNSFIDFSMKDRFIGRKFVFLDNSCYRGRTRDKIASRLAEAGAELVDSFVLYDGSVEEIDGIEGLWRYH